MTTETAPTLNPLDALTVGIEIECYLPTGATQQTGARAVAARLGAPCAVIPYHAAHQTCTTWKVVSDGSLRDYARGSEFVSPVLSGEASVKQVDTVCEALTDFGATVTRDCGLHVHVGADGQPLDFFKNLVRLYQAYEPVIDTFMPASRRASTNGFCRSLTSVPATTITNARSVPELAEAIRRVTGAMEARYHKLNVDAFRRHKTVEFRQHSGTTDARKTRLWVSICKKMVQAAKGQINFGSVLTQQMNRARRGTKAHQIGEMLLRQDGASGREICTAMNWPSVSVPAQARAAGLDVYSQRLGREVRYYVRRAPAQTPSTLTITVDGFCDVINASTEEREYLNERARNLRGTVAWAA